jgi:hypothetical protein
MLAVMDKNRTIITQDVSTLVFYMNGGLNFDQAWQLSGNQRKIMSQIIEKHYEASSGLDKKKLI